MTSSKRSNNYQLWFPFQKISQLLQFLVLVVFSLLLQGCTPKFKVTEKTVWPPDKFDSQNDYPGILVISRSAELQYFGGLWAIHAISNQPIQLDDDWKGYSLESSPDGSQLAYVVCDSGQFQVRILNVGNGELDFQHTISFTPGSMTWASNNRLFFQIFRSTGEDYETVRGMVTPGDYGYATLDIPSEEEEIYFPDWGLHESQFGGPWIAFSPRGNTALIHYEQWEATTPGLHAVNWDLATGQIKWAYPIFYDTSYSWSPDGKSVAIVDSPDENKPFDEEILLIDSSTGEAERLTFYLDTIVTDRLFGIYWSPDSRYILHWLRTDTGTDSEPDPGTLYLIDTKTRQAVNLGITYGEIANLTWSPDSNYFAFQTPDGVVVVDILIFRSFYAYSGVNPRLLEWIIP